MTGLKLFSKFPWLRMNLNMFSWSCLEHESLHHITLDDKGPFTACWIFGEGVVQLQREEPAEAVILICKNILLFFLLQRQAVFSFLNILKSKHGNMKNHVNLSEKQYAIIHYFEIVNTVQFSFFRCFMWYNLCPFSLFQKQSIKINLPSFG